MSFASIPMSSNEKAFCGKTPIVDKLRKNKNMKFVYFFRDSGEANSGVEKKMRSQVKNLSKYGLNPIVYRICVNDEQSAPNNSDEIINILTHSFLPVIIRKIEREHLINIALIDTIASLQKNDIIYLRIPFPSLFLSWKLRKPRACKVVIEYQTIEPPEFRSKGQYWYLILDLLYGRALRRYTDAIVGVTDEVTQYEVFRSGDRNKPHITIANGIDVESVVVRNPPQHLDEILHILCVANVSRWHGLDRLLQGLATYSETPEVVLHIAGGGAELPTLQKMVNDLGITDRVVFHGFLTGIALDKLFDQCHIAVGSLGIHRIGLKEASILKAREYCARGIPFIYGISDPDFTADFPYILHFSADESPIDIEKVLAFVKEVCTDPDHPQKMRCFAEEHLDWSTKMKKLKDFLEKLTGE